MHEPGLCVTSYAQSKSGLCISHVLFWIHSKRDTMCCTTWYQVTTYPLVLLKLMNEEGWSTKLLPKCAGTESLTFNIPLHILMKALITHVPSSETITREFLFKLRKYEDLLVETLCRYVTLLVWSPSWANLATCLKLGNHTQGLTIWLQMNGQTKTAEIQWQAWPLKHYAAWESLLILSSNPM